MTTSRVLDRRIPTGLAVGLPDRTSLLAASAIAVLGEFLLQRVLARVAIHIPELPLLRGPYAVLTAVGSTFFVAAAVLVLSALVLSVRAESRRLRWQTGLVFLLALLPFGIAGWGSGVAGVRSGAEPTLTALYIVAVIVAGTLLIARTDVLARGMSVALVVSLLVGAASTVPAVSGVWHASRVSALAEASLLIAIALAPVALVRARLRRAEFAAAMVVVAVVIASQLANAATLNVLGLWGLGLTGALPVPLYWAAAGGLSLALVHLVRERQAWPALALLFVALGGVGLHNTYQSSVQLLALCTLLEYAPALSGSWASMRLRNLAPDA